MSFLDEAQDIFEYTRDMRRDFHRHPEIGFKEVRTANIVADELGKLGLEVKTGVGQTGVVAVLNGKASGPVVLLRFDMDALPVQEETGADYASVNPGVMHACGHDGHIAVGLSVARLLRKHSQEFNGIVKLMFQPAEEGMGGAEQMIADGVLDNPKPEFALALHVWNEKPVGWLGIAPGPVMAAADKFSIGIIGKGGHGAMPNLCNDPILAASQVINLMQGIVSRNVSPLQSAVVTVGSIRGGEAFNVIPSEVIMMGTIRSFETTTRELVIKRIHQIVENTAHAMDCQAQIDIKSLTPAVFNDPGISQRVQKVAEILFTQAELDYRFVTMVSEDMGLVFEKVPGCYLFVGSANKEMNLAASHHSSKFNFDENILPKAVGLMVASTMELLNS